VSVPRSLHLHAAVEPTTLELDGYRLAALRAVPIGADVRGEVVLVHGFTGSKEDFAPLLPLLADLGWAATAIDLRGQHESPHDGTDLSTTDFARDVVDVVRLVATRTGTDTSVHLVGHSFGGLVVRAAVLDVDADVRIDTVTLLSSGPAAVADEQAAALQAFVAAVRMGAIDAVWEHLAAGYRDAGTTDDGILTFLERRLRSGHPRSHIAIAEALLGEPDRVDELAAATVEVHVVHGADDDVWTAAVQRTMAERLDAAITTLADTGHSPAVEAPDRTAQALHQWWTAAGADR
jgi:pimeloyl-ACP methyl ester carboxylesterase